MKSFLNGRVFLYPGDCLETMGTLAENSIDAVVTDPPYHLTTDKKGGTGVASLNLKSPAGRSRISTGFMGKSWDGGDIAFSPEAWAKVLRVLKPGGHLVAFGAPRNYHRLACAIEDAGFEVRDSLMWVFGSGFPKSHNVALAIDKMGGMAPRGKAFNFKGRGDGADEFDANGREFPPAYEPITDAARQWQGWGTALKPSYEPIVLARKPLSEGTVAANVLKWGTGALHVDATRIETDDVVTNHSRSAEAAVSKGIYGDSAAQATHQTAGQKRGRWPANLCHDGSDEVLELFPESKGQIADVSFSAPSPRTRNTYGKMSREGEASAERRYTENGSTNFAALPGQRRNDSGSAARFYYQAKASKADRAGSNHPTVKPVSLMRWLARLVTPPGGVILDPFAGTGTTAEAAYREGFSAILCERETEYVANIERRMTLISASPMMRKNEIAKMRDRADSAGPLFGDEA